MLVEKKHRNVRPVVFFRKFSHENSTKPQNRRIRRMTGNITANDLAYYCPPVPSFSGETARPAGGTLLSQLIGALTYGAIPSVYSATKRKDEFEKIIRSITKVNLFISIIDNLETGMDWTPAALLSATSDTGDVISWDMGTFDSFTAEATTLYIVNGINVEIRADVTRRMFRIRLVTKKAGQNGYSRTKNRTPRRSCPSPAEDHLGIRRSLPKLEN